MRRLFKVEVLDVLNVLRNTLRDLENVKLVPDPEVNPLRADLRKTITEIEKDCTPEYEHESTI